MDKEWSARKSTGYEQLILVRLQRGRWRKIEEEPISQEWYRKQGDMDRLPKSKAKDGLRACGNL